MAHLPQSIQFKKSMKYTDQCNENYVTLSNKSSNSQLNPRFKEKLSFVSPGQPVTTNISIPIPLNDSTLNKQYKSEQNSISLKSNNSSGERKSQVYVHHYKRIPSRSPSNFEQSNSWRGGNEIHQNMYKHEFSDFYDAKIKTLRRQFDNLSLRKTRTNSPTKIPRIEYYNQQGKIPFIRSNASSKINRALLFRPEHKAAMDKLEETYWAKWKPKKVQPTKESYPKTKGLYTENEKIRAPSEIIHRSVRKERGDSNEGLAVSHTSSRKSELATENGLLYVEDKEVPVQEEAVREEPAIENEINEVDHRDEPKNSGEAITELTHESDSECSIGGLKHTDSFILTAKKQNPDKPHYQQPKCIKLFKNAGYSPSGSINYIKGGSYPLKSCLKKDCNFSKLSHLGRPGSPLKGTTARIPGKANRFTK